MLLGWFKYVVKSFFKQIGHNGVACKKYVRLCHSIASQLGRQSDRDIPRTTTNDFSTAANIPGHEYAGILLIMLLAFETSRYGEIFDRARALVIQGGDAKKHPGHDCFIADWKCLLSSLLEWWAWMKQPQIERRCVKRSMYATAYLMRLLKAVAPRHDGMKNNTIKTHLVLHMADDIQNFGVPEMFNSAYAESAHIPIAKKTVRNTQKRNESYEFQAAQRYAENLVISHASRQICSEDKSNGLLCDAARHKQWIGKSYSITANAVGTPQCSWRSDNRKKGDEGTPQLAMDQHLLQSIADYLLPCLEPPIAHCQTEYTCPKGVLYRAHPNYEDKPWFDHVLVDWDDVAIPAKILCIVNLHNAKPDSVIKFPGQNRMAAEPGLYVVVQQSYNAIDTVADKAAKAAAKEVSMHVLPKERRQRKNRIVDGRSRRVNQTPVVAEELSEDGDPPIFKAYRLLLGANNEDNANLPCLYIIHVDSIVGPTVVISDISREYGTHDPPAEAYPLRPYIFMFRRRHQWAHSWTSFIDWQYNKTVHDGEKESSEEEG